MCYLEEDLHKVLAPKAQPERFAQIVARIQIIVDENILSFWTQTESETDQDQKTIDKINQSKRHKLTKAKYR